MTARPKLWVAGDLNGLFGLGTNSVLNTLVAIGLMAGVMKFSPELVYGRIGPGLVLSLAVGNIYFAYMAWKLGVKEGRADTTAVPYGISVPHYFLVTFAVMLPLYFKTNDLEFAWSVGVAWCFVHAIIAYIGAFIGPTMQRLTPRAAMLGTLAGVAITYIAMGAAFQAFNVAWIGMISLGIIFIGWLANVSFPFKLPAGLVAVLVGIVVGWSTGYMDADALSTAVAGASFNLPLPVFAPLTRGLPFLFSPDGLPILTAAIPLAIYLFLESLNNVESSLAAGDKYDTREAMLAAATGTLVASLFGSPFPTLIYIGHLGWKSVGARVGYSWATGVMMLVLGTVGLLGILGAVIPLVAILPILMYIGMIITSQAFTASPARHAPAVALALIPWIADWTGTQIRNSLNAAGTSPEMLGYDALQGSGVYFQGLSILGAGSILAGMILAAIAAYAIDRNWKGAIGYSLFGAACSWFGIIHSSVLRVAPDGSTGFSAAYGPTVGYLAVALTCYLMMMYTSRQEAASPAAAAAGD